MTYILFFLSLFIHDVAVSYFTIHLDEYPYRIVVEMDMHYAQTIHTLEDSSNTDGRIEMERVLDYASEHLQLSLNQKNCAVHFSSYRTNDKGHLFISGILEFPQEEVHSLQLTNQFYLDVDSAQVNSVMIHQLSKEVRGFKMNVERRVIDVKL